MNVLIITFTPCCTPKGYEFEQDGILQTLFIVVPPPSFKLCPLLLETHTWSVISVMLPDPYDIKRAYLTSCQESPLRPPKQFALPKTPFSMKMALTGSQVANLSRPTHATNILCVIIQSPDVEHIYHVRFFTMDHCAVKSIMMTKVINVPLSESG